MVGFWLAHGWFMVGFMVGLMVGFWLVSCLILVGSDWFMVGSWLVHGWPMAGWFMVGSWLVYGWFMMALNKRNRVKRCQLSEHFADRFRVNPLSRAVVDTSGPVQSIQ